MRDAMRRTVSILALITVTGFAGLTLPAAAQTLDTSTLPRVAGAKELFANAATTVYISPKSVAWTTEATRKALTAAGWQIYTAPHTQTAKSPNMAIMSFKKGSLGLNVLIKLAPTQANATSVSYSGIPLPNDLPLPKDARATEYDPHRPLLMCLTAAGIDETLAYYREALGDAGWSLWSAKAGDRQPPGGSNGTMTDKGAYAYYKRADDKALVLTLQRVGGDTRIELKGVPMQVLVAAHQAEVNHNKPPAVAKPATPTARPAAKEPDEIDRMMKQGQQMALEAIASALSGKPPAQQKQQKQMAAASDAVPAIRADDSVPIPLPETAGDVDYRSDDSRIEFDSRSSVPALAAFYRAEMKKRGWQEQRSVINRANMVVLNFSKSKDRLSLTIMKFGDHAKLSGNGSALAAQMANAPSASAQADSQPAAGDMPQLPMPAGAQEVTYDKDNGTMEFTSTSSVKELTEFYQAEMTRQGWTETTPAVVRPRIAMLRYARADDGVSLIINVLGNTTTVEASGSYLQSAAAKNAPPSADDLKVEESGGLPVPRAHESAESEKTGMRRALKADVRLKLSTTLDFYRRELDKRQWKEKQGAVVADNHAEIAYASPEGPAVLRLGRKAGHTTVDLEVKNPKEAAKAGLLPKSGQAKLVFGNMLKSNAVITVGKKKIKIGAGVGDKEPDGPKLDLAPGKYKLVLQVPGKPAQSEDVEVKGDETWGVIVAPGGLLPLQVY